MKNRQKQNEKSKSRLIFVKAINEGKLVHLFAADTAFLPVQDVSEIRRSRGCTCMDPRLM